MFKTLRKFLARFSGDPVFQTEKYNCVVISTYPVLFFTTEIWWFGGYRKRVLVRAVTKNALGERITTKYQMPVGSEINASTLFVEYKKTQEQINQMCKDAVRLWKIADQHFSKFN